MLQRRSDPAIVIRGARQNNLKNLSLEIPTGELVVVTGVSGSGKSSLVFDTLYAEGQRRYVETFSPYARQFLDRMDKPQVDAVEGIPPAIAIDQTNPVRTSRSTVGTMTELNDHLKLLFARAARLHCRGCGKPVVRDTPQSIYEFLLQTPAQRVVITFPVDIPKNFSEKEVEQLLERQGYTRFHSRSKSRLEVIQDRLRMPAERERVIEALESALRVGQGRVNIYPENQGQTTFSEATAQEKTWSVPDFAWRYSSGLHCADCDIHYSEATPAAFSFNSPLGACETCRGFGRVIGVDFGLVVPDEAKTLRAGAVRPWQSPSFHDCQGDLVKYAKKRGIPLDLPFNQLNSFQKNWVLEGEADWQSWRKSWPGTWYGVRRFFKWLETKAYKMHIRVLLSKYRAYTECGACRGTRLKPDALLWKLDGASIHELMLLPVSKVNGFFQSLSIDDEAADLVLREIRTRLGYLCEVGLGYLTLDRQSRTLSGGEVQRINLTTALGTSLVNTLFVLDEPSIGLHPRDMGRVIGVMQRLRDAGNSLVVVEHDPQIMFAADRIMDMGPGPGERGGSIVYDGPPNEIEHSDTLTGAYLGGRKHVAHASNWQRRAVDAKTPRLVLEGATEHNLRDVTVEVPLQRLVCVTGVSGSGKSTLIQDVLAPALQRHFGKATESPGAFRALKGADALSEVIFVDQSPIGRTARSNPASYVGAFDEIRKLF